MSQDLLTQLAQLQSQNLGLSHQLEASKQMLNEQLEVCFRLRTQALGQNQNLFSVGKQLADAQLENKKLHDDNAAHLAKITELDAKLNPPQPEVQPEPHDEIPNPIPDNGQ